jgi:hypothetical protein
MLPIGSDDLLARLFAQRHAGAVRYVVTERKWFLRTGDGQWQPDTTLAVVDMARKLCREQAQSMAPEKARRVTSAAKIMAVLRLARSDPALAWPW